MYGASLVSASLEKSKTIHINIEKTGNIIRPSAQEQEGLFLLDIIFYWRGAEAFFAVISSTMSFLKPS